MQTIYALTEASGEVRYVGRTVDIERRMVDHFCQSASGQIREWVAGCELRGEPASMRVLAEVADDTHAAAIERFFIETVYAGASLLNGQRVRATPVGTDTNGPTLFVDALRLQGISQRAAARTLGLSTGVVTHWLNGDRRPCLRVALRIRDAFGVPVEAWDKP